MPVGEQNTKSMDPFRADLVFSIGFALSRSRDLLHHLLEHGDIVGRDAAGRTVIQLAVDDWALDKLLTFDADAAELEDGGDDEPDADDEENGSPVAVDLVRPKVVRRRRALVSGCVG